MASLRFAFTRLRVALIRSRVTRGIDWWLDIYGRHPKRIP